MDISPISSIVSKALQTFLIDQHLLTSIIIFLISIIILTFCIALFKGCDQNRMFYLINILPVHSRV
jgi:hypothetical protein